MVKTLHHIKITFAISRIKTEKHINRTTELNYCKKLICDLSLKKNPSSKKKNI